MRILLLGLGIFGPYAFAAPQDDYAAGQKAYLGGDVVSARAPLKRAADAGHAGAQSLYGYILDRSDDNEEAAKYFRMAAEQGNADGQYGLGTLYAAGEGVKKDGAAARQWFERAGAQGHALAVMALAQAYIGGQLGFKRDPADPGFAWVRKAADLDSIPALAFLAKVYRSGELGTVDLAQADRLDARIRELLPAQKKGRGKK